MKNSAGYGGRGRVWRGGARLGKARQGSICSSTCEGDTSQVGCGLAGRGEARRGAVWQDKGALRIEDKA